MLICYVVFLVARLALCMDTVKNSNNIITVPRRSGFVTVGREPTDVTYEAITLRLANLNDSDVAVSDEAFLKCTDFCVGRNCKEVCARLHGLTRYIALLVKRHSASLGFARQITDNVLSLGAMPTDANDVVAPAAFLASSWKSYTESLVREPSARHLNSRLVDILTEHMDGFKDAHALCLVALRNLTSVSEEVFDYQYPLAVMIYGHALDFAIAGLDQYSSLMQACYRSIVETKSVGGCAFGKDVRGRFESIRYSPNHNHVTIMSVPTTRKYSVLNWADLYIPFAMNGTVCWLDLDLVTINGSVYYTPDCEGPWCANPTPANIRQCFVGGKISCPHHCSKCKGPACCVGKNTFDIITYTGVRRTTVELVEMQQEHINASYVSDVARSIQILNDQVQSVSEACTSINNTATYVTTVVQIALNTIDGMSMKMTELWNYVISGAEMYSEDHIRNWTTFVYVGLGLSVSAFVIACCCGVVQLCMSLK